MVVRTERAAIAQPEVKETQVLAVVRKRVGARAAKGDRRARPVPAMGAVPLLAVMAGALVRVLVRTQAVAAAPVVRERVMAEGLQLTNPSPFP